MNRVLARVVRTALLAACGPIIGCSAAAHDSSAERDADTSQATTPTLSTVAASVCDSVATRWRGANVAFTRADSVAQLMSMNDSGPVCVVTAVAEDDPGMKLMSFSYWTDSTIQGWRGITAWDADGPDGMSRTLFRPGVRCQVDGEWDGGDDADPTAERSKRVIERTTCRGDSTGLTARDTATG